MGKNDQGVSALNRTPRNHSAKLSAPALLNLEDILENNHRTNTQKAQDVVSLIRGPISPSHFAKTQIALGLADLQFRGVTRRKRSKRQGPQPVKPNTLEYVGNQLTSHFNEETPAKDCLTDTAAHFYWAKNNTYEILFESIDNRTSFAKSLNKVVKDLHDPTKRYNSLQAATDIYATNSFDVDDNLLEAAKAITGSGRSWESKYQAIESHLQKFQESAGARKLSVEEEDLVKRMQSYVETNRTLQRSGRAKTARSSYSDIRSSLLNDLNTLGMFGSDGFVGSWQDETDEDSGLFDQLPSSPQYQDQNVPNTPTYAEGDSLSQENPFAEMQFTPTVAIPFGANDSHATYQERKLKELTEGDKLELAKELGRRAAKRAEETREPTAPKKEQETYVSKPIPESEPIVVRDMPKCYPLDIDKDWGEDDISPVSKVVQIPGTPLRVYDLTKKNSSTHDKKSPSVFSKYLGVAGAMTAVALAGCVAALHGASSPAELYQSKPAIVQVEQSEKPTTRPADSHGPTIEISDKELKAQYAAKGARDLGIDVAALYTPFAVEMDPSRTSAVRFNRPSPTQIQSIANAHGLTMGEVRADPTLMKKVNKKTHWGVDTNARDAVVEVQAVVDGFYCKSKSGSDSKGFGDIIIGFDKSGAFAQDLGSHDTLAVLYAHLDKDGYSGLWDDRSRQVDLLTMKYMFPEFDRKNRKTQCIHAQGGEVLATVGDTGSSTHPHLHFEAGVCNPSDYAGLSSELTWINNSARHELFRTGCTSIDPMPLLQTAEKYTFRWDPNDTPIQKILPVTPAVVSIDSYLSSIASADASSDTGGKDTGIIYVAQ